MSDMQDKLRAISGLSLGCRVIGEKPYGERMMASSPDLSAAEKLSAKRKWARAYYMKYRKTQKSGRGTK